MNKMIIENRTNLSDLDVLMLVAEVVQQGRFFNGQYCYVTGILWKDGEYYVSTALNKKSDRFVITKRPDS